MTDTLAPAVVTPAAALAEFEVRRPGISFTAAEAIGPLIGFGVPGAIGPRLLDHLLRAVAATASAPGGPYVDVAVWEPSSAEHPRLCLSGC